MPERCRGQKVREEAEERATDHPKPRDAESRGGKAEESAVGGQHRTQAGNSTCELLLPVVTSVTELKPRCSQAAQSPVGLHTSLGSHEPVGSDATAVPTVRGARISCPASAARLESKPPAELAPGPGSADSANPTNVIAKSQHTTKGTAEALSIIPAFLFGAAPVTGCRAQRPMHRRQGVDKGSCNSLDKPGTPSLLPELGLGIELSPWL